MLVPDQLDILIIIEFRVCFIDNLLSFILLQGPLGMLHRLLAYVKQAQAQLEANARKPDRNALQLSAHKQLVSMLDSSPLVIDEVISMTQLLEANAMKVSRGKMHRGFLNLPPRLIQ